MTLYGYIANFLAVLAYGAPVYYVIFRHRYWFSVFISWLLIVTSQQLAVLASTTTDQTTVGLVLFSGWLISIPFCGFLLLIRLILDRFNVLLIVDRGENASLKNEENEGEQAAPSNR